MKPQHGSATRTSHTGVAYWKRLNAHPWHAWPARWHLPYVLLCARVFSASVTPTSVLACDPSATI